LAAGWAAISLNYLQHQRLKSLSSVAAAMESFSFVTPDVMTAASDWMTRSLSRLFYWSAYNSRNKPMV
jgi:hypothetical protein